MAYRWSLNWPAIAVAIGVAETMVHINDRFAVLTHGRRTAPLQQRTLRSMLDWSFNLFSVSERTVLQRLAVFAHPTMFLAALADAQARAGQYEEPLVTVDAALDRCNSHGERWCMADLLRIKAEVTGRDTAQGAAAQALRDLTGALELARR